jgi:IclR family acetate operon transcriptional repressor
VTSPTGTQAVDRAAQLLIEVARHRAPVSFTELTAASGLAKSTTSRLLMALERNGLVRRDGAGRFSPGEVFVSYAWRGGAEADLVSVAQPVLAQLGEQTGETVNIGVPRDGGLVEQIAQVDSRYLIGGTNWVGLTVPLHCAALGKVLLAFGAAELPRGKLDKRTDRTITSRVALAAELTAVRERGYAVTIEELEPGLVAVAAPVFVGGTVFAGMGVASTGVASTGVANTGPGHSAAVAALSVSAPASRLGSGQLTAAAEACMAGARSLSALLGYAPGTNHAPRPNHPPVD